jgi:glutathione S-transferase
MQANHLHDASLTVTVAEVGPFVRPVGGNAVQQITITGFRQVPDFARGVVRDLRLRWVLNELGRDYAVRLIEQSERSDPSFLELQPFGMVPSMIVEGTSMFESGAILFTLAEGTDLAGPSQNERNNVLTWIFAALNTVEPFVTLLFGNDVARSDKNWARESRADIIEIVERRVAVLEARLSKQDYLLSQFTAADIAMVTTLRFLKHANELARFPAVAAYVSRCEQRPTFIAALNAQLGEYDRPVGQE